MKPVLNRRIDINKNEVSTTFHQRYNETTLNETTLFKDPLVALKKNKSIPNVKFAFCTGRQKEYLQEAEPPLLIFGLSSHLPHALCP